MFDKKMENQIQICIQNKWHCCIKREKIDDCSLFCIPQKMSKDLLLLSYTYDFQFDGYQIIRTRDITFVRREETEEHSEMIFEKEKIFQPYSCVMQIEIDSFYTIFQQLVNQNIIIECENKEDPAFFIGEIMHVTNDSVDIWNFDGVGEWDEFPTTVNYADITCLTLESKYLNLMSKYTSERKALL